MKKKEPEGYAERYKAIFWGEPKAKPKRKIKVRARPIKRKAREVIKGIKIPSAKEVRTLQEDYPDTKWFAKVLTRKPYKRDIEKRRKKGIKGEALGKGVPISPRMMNYYKTGQRRMGVRIAKQFKHKQEQTDEYFDYFRDSYYADAYADEPEQVRYRTKKLSRKEAKAYIKRVWKERDERGIKRRWLKTPDTP